MGKYKLIATIAKIVAKVEQKFPNEPGNFKLDQALKLLPVTYKSKTYHALTVCIIDVIILIINFLERKKKIDFFSVLLVVKKIISVIERF